MDKILTNIKQPLMLIGLLLVIVGSGLLLYVAVLVIQVIHDPQSVQITQFVLQQAQVEDKAISGHLDGRAFEVVFAQTWKTVSFLFVGVVVLAVLAGILKKLISAGLQIMKLAVAGNTAEQPQSGIGNEQ